MKSPERDSKLGLDKDYCASIDRYNSAADAMISGERFKVLELTYNNNANSNTSGTFKIPMARFKWTESFQGMFTMLLDDDSARTICACKTEGSVRIPLYSHDRNERIILIEGVIIDHTFNKTYIAGDVIDYPMTVLRSIEFIDAVFNMIFTPPLSFQINEQ